MSLPKPDYHRSEWRLDLLQDWLEHMRVIGHKLTITFSGETSRAERSSTGHCTCGWSESCRLQSDVRGEYQRHLQAILAENAKKTAATRDL